MYLCVDLLFHFLSTQLAELDDLAAKMNADFEEAEGFDLVVE